MLLTKTCVLSTCGIEFQTDNPRKSHCTRQHATLDRVRRHKAKRRKGGGGDGPGGGGSPTLFDTITPIDPRALTINPLPVIGPCERRPPESIKPEKSPVPASKRRCAVAA